ncbi:Endonuclease/Exonuclease/phosphatase family protein [Novipirellula aureliae]|uniref:Endonuclease/Exonuclease/phosphatase family protein n=1 Tax=Novipirellula aureliae TaxID=2527966 RepID=A0A5C6DXX7_9BACT|nr:endonuclease/exonuclease/phosphatase family protein [Novipirellula aureliae]TWU41265.1 Endonuclease/Exonuclease/phosphatase family protein [Novipirellula aureliae]
MAFDRYLTLTYKAPHSMRYLFLFSIACLLGTMLPAIVMAQTNEVVYLDGEVSEWQPSDVLANDPAGDTEGIIDLAAVSVRMNGCVMFVRLKTHEPVGLQSGRPEEGTLRMIVKMPTARKLTIDFRNRSATLSGSDSESTLAWADLDFVCLPTFASNDFEMRIDLGRLGVEPNDELTIGFDGSDSLDGILSISVPQRAMATTREPFIAERSPGCIRIASMNTLHQGTCDPERSASIRRLFVFANADVYCFNEEWDESGFRQGAPGVIPNASQDTSYHWQNGCGIATKFELTPIPLSLYRGAAALIQFPNGERIVVISIHFDCCGSSGSKEDRLRVYEAEHVLAQIARIRTGEFGEQAKDAGVVLLGDYNLVGSRKPLDILNQGGLQDIMLRSPVDGSAVTWRAISPRESFWPGRLDYVTVDTSRLQTVGGFLIHSDEFSSVDQNAANMVTASDHAMMVVDLEEG